MAGHRSCATRLAAPTIALAAFALAALSTLSSGQKLNAAQSSQQQELTQVIKRCQSAVVLIEVRDASDKVTKAGSGFIVSADGKIATRNHLLKGARSAFVKLSNGQLFRVEGLVARDEKADIAILKVAGNNLPVLAFGDSDKTGVGEPVIAIGNPLGLENSVSSGIVSGVREDSGRKWIQTTAAVSPGTSGGPLINPRGEVVGMVTGKLAGGENLSFAAPSNSITTLLAFAGSSVKALDSGAARHFKFALGQAVYVASNNPIMGKRASEQFAKDRQFRVAGGLSGADFVFLAVLHWSGEESALVLLPNDYSEHEADLDALRDLALWRGGAQLRSFRSEIKRLVQQFEHDVLQSSESRESR